LVYGEVVIERMGSRTSSDKEGTPTRKNE
jgi:hypothetical protein